MRFFSGIINALAQKLGTVAFVYKLSRMTQEQLDFIAAEKLGFKGLDGNRWVGLNYATGRAITGWAFMEDELVLIGSLLLRTTPHKAGLVFFSIINFQAWIAIITELFELDEDFKPFQRRWNKIFERLRAEKDFRDRLAHNYIMSENVSDNPLGVPIKAASIIDMRSKSRKAPPMTVDQVLAFRRRIDAIAKDIERLNRDMLKVMTPSALPEKSSAQVPDQGT